MGHTFLMTVIISHLLVVFGNLASMFVIPFYVPWYIAIPLISVLINLLFMPTQCPLTKLENRIRRSLGLRQIRHFVGHYLVWPIKRKIRQRKEGYNEIYSIWDHWAGREPPC